MSKVVIPGVLKIGRARGERVLDRFDLSNLFRKASKKTIVIILHRDDHKTF